MRRHRFPLLLLITTLGLPPGLAAADAPMIETYRAGNSSAVEAGVLHALPTANRDLADLVFFSPADPNATPVDGVGPRITATAAITLASSGNNFSGLDSMETLTGADGEYLTRIGFDVRNLGDNSFYNSRPDATLFLIEFSGEPVAPEGGIFGISLAFTWPGEEVLLSASTRFASDPLVGFAHSAETGEVAGDAFDYYASVENQQWVQYANPLLTFGSVIHRDRSFFWYGALVPGVPERAAATLSYADDPTDPDTLISQQAVFDIPPRIEYSALEFEFSRLAEEDQMALEDRWGFVLAGADITTTNEAESTTTTSTTTTTTPAVTTSPDDPEEAPRAAGDGGDSSVLPLLLLVLGILALLALASLLSAVAFGRPGVIAAMLPARFRPPDRSDPEYYETIGTETGVVVGSGKDVAAGPADDGPPKIDWGGPPGSEVVIEDTEPHTETDWTALRGAKGKENESLTTTIIEWHRRSGGTILGDEWIAPDEDTVLRAQYGGEGSGTAGWSRTFINIRTGEWVEEPDPLHRELRERFGVDPEPFDIGGTPIS